MNIKFNKNSTEICHKIPYFTFSATIFLPSAVVPSTKIVTRSLFANQTKEIISDKCAFKTTIFKYCFRIRLPSTLACFFIKGN